MNGKRTYPALRSILRDLLKLRENEKAGKVGPQEKEVIEMLDKFIEEYRDRE